MSSIVCVAVTAGHYDGSAGLYEGCVLAMDLNSLRVTDFVKPSSGDERREVQRTDSM